jgi:hypothetical protein
VGLAGLAGLPGLSGIVPGAVASVGDSDAAAFISAAATLNSTEQSAITSLVSALKANGTWSKYRVIYPFVGGTASTHALNLKDPGNDSLSFPLPTTHSTGGITENGSTGGNLATVSLSYNGILNPSSSYHLATYYGTPGAGLTDLELLTASDATEPYLYAGFRYANNQNAAYIAAGRFISSTSYSGWENDDAWARSGYQALYSTSTTQGRGRYRDGTGLWRRGGNGPLEPHDNTWNSSNVTTGFLLCRNTGTPISWLALGGILTETEITNDAAAVHAFQQALGRGAAY